MHVAQMRGIAICTPLYECVLCHKNRAGSSTVELQFESPAGLAEQVLRMRPPAHHMPIGWSSNLDGFRCGEHND